MSRRGALEQNLEAECQSTANATLCLCENKHRAVGKYIRPVALGKQILQVHQRVDSCHTVMSAKQWLTELHVQIRICSIV